MCLCVLQSTSTKTETHKAGDADRDESQALMESRSKQSNKEVVKEEQHGETLPPLLQLHWTVCK